MDNISLSLLTLYEALANSPYTTITGDLDTTATSITIVDPAAIPSTFPCLLTIGYDTSTAETVLATSISGDTLTVTRGVDGTLQTWTAGSRISRVFTAKDLNDIQTNISRIAAAIGSASLDTEAQTLVGAINELDAGKCKLVKGYLSSSTGAFYSDSGFTTLVTDNENPNNLYLDLNSYRLYKYIAVGTGVLDVGYNLITVDDDLDVIRTPKYGVCSTAAGTAAKAVTINGITSLVTGLTIAVKFSNNNTAASPTLQVNSLTAKPIYQHGTTPAGTDDATTGWYAGAVVILAYDGTGWVMSKGVNNALDAGDVVYDNQETYASGTVGKEVSDLNGAITVYIENGNTSTRAYGVGQYILWKGAFYKVISAITSSGITFTPNTNIKATNVGEELSAIREAVPITTFQNDWETNGECFYQIIRNVYHLHCSIRNGTNNAMIISFGTSAAPSIATMSIILSTSGVNGYAQINTSGQVTVNNVSNTGSVFFDLFWKKHD